MSEKSAREILLNSQCCFEVRKGKLCGHDGAYCVKCQKVVDDAIAALSAAGLTIVPVEPTPEMLHAATMQVPTWDDEASRLKWSAMLTAAKD